VAAGNLLGGRGKPVQRLGDELGHEAVNDRFDVGPELVSNDGLESLPRRSHERSFPPCQRDV
jgi:hypothetical protein